MCTCSFAVRDQCWVSPRESVDSSEPFLFLPFCAQEPRPPLFRISLLEPIPRSYPSTPCGCLSALKISIEASLILNLYHYDVQLLPLKTTQTLRLASLSSLPHRRRKSCSNCFLYRASSVDTLCSWARRQERHTSSGETNYLFMCAF